MSAELIARIIGQTIGGLFPAFLFSRFIRVFAFKTITLINVVIVGIITLGIVSTFASLVSKSQFLSSLIQFAPSVIILMIYDLVRGQREIPQHYLNYKSDGNTDLIRYASEGDIENAKLLLASGENVNTKNKQGATALLIAVLNNRPSMVSLLLSYGADASIASNKGLTAKSLASNKKYSEISQLLSAVKG